MYALRTFSCALRPIASVRVLSSEASGSNSSSKCTVSHFPLLAEAVKTKNVELVAKIIFDEDPFEVKRVVMPQTTSRRSPNLVASESSHRMVGCICEPEADAINWMELKKGDPVQCYCGHWFKLVSYEEFFEKYQ